MKYRHIFFDLDRTLYDFDKSSHHTFLDLFRAFNLHELGVKSFDSLFASYRRINMELWEQYKTGQMEKELLNVQRFYLTFLESGVDDRALAAKFASAYIRESPLKPFLFPYAKEALYYLYGKYKLHIITNGFEEVQREKLRANDLGKFFSTITTSEEAGVKKPFPEIFRYALQKAGAFPEESLMVGDDLEVDILGAKSIGMDQVFYNHDRMKHSETLTCEIYSLREMMELL